jgi:5-hydroxyisourate hydrolase/2-oxo-4-hydroxy-4-carboxy-5-ureidoimidazoline decarboxylase
MAVGSLISFVRDTVGEKPMAGIRLQLYWVENHGDVLVRAGATNANGTTDTPLLESSKLSAGTYKLVLHVGDYFAGENHPDAKRYLDVLPVVFVVDDASARTRIDVDVTPASYTVRHTTHGNG